MRGNNPVVLVADPIVLNNSDSRIYTSNRTPKEIVEQMGGHFVDGPITDDMKFPAGKTVFSYQPTLTPAQITEEVGDGKYDGVVVAAKAVLPKPGQEQMNGKPFVGFAVRIGAGTNNVEEVGKAGGVVMNTPGFNSQPTADAIVKAFNLALTPDGKPERTNAYDPTDLYAQSLDISHADSNDLSPYNHGGMPPFSGTKPDKKKVAIIGAGHIGGLVMESLKADGHEVVPYSRSNTKYAASVLEAVKDADVIIIQTPLNPSTENLINEEVLNAAKRGVLIINAARGGVVDINALDKAVMSGQVGGFIADLDHYPDKDSPMTPYVKLANKAKSHKSINPNSPIAVTDQTIILTPHTYADTHSPSREVGGMQAIRQALRAIAIQHHNFQEPYINPVGAGFTRKLTEDGTKPWELHPSITAGMGYEGLVTAARVSKGNVAGQAKA